MTNQIKQDTINISDLENESLIAWVSLAVRTKILLETISLLEISIEKIKLSE